MKVSRDYIRNLIQHRKTQSLNEKRLIGPKRAVFNFFLSPMEGGLIPETPPPCVRHRFHSIVTAPLCGCWGPPKGPRTLVWETLIYETFPDTGNLTIGDTLRCLFNNSSRSFLYERINLCFAQCATAF